MFEIRPDHTPVTIDCPLHHRVMRAGLEYGFYADTGNPETSFHIWGIFDMCEEGSYMEPACLACIERVNRVLHQAHVDFPIK